ncbi:hypothetical protein [Devosia sp.]|uniref:hypothetical protein n=1 Tax=Devosia sp. TaxID=1871048 RepID=UPI002AFE73F1|nr:hypothetical protein [Devosia sp.]
MEVDRSNLEATGEGSLYAEGSKANPISVSYVLHIRPSTLYRRGKWLEAEIQLHDPADFDQCLQLESPTLLDLGNGNNSYVEISFNELIPLSDKLHIHWRRPEE